MSRVLFFWLWLSFPMVCISQTVPLEKYQADLRQCLELVQQAKANPGAAAGYLLQARRILPMKWQVARGPKSGRTAAGELSGETVTIPADMLLQQLYSAQTADKDVGGKLEDLEQELAWLLEESSKDAEPWYAGKADGARKQLDEILARSEFHRGISESPLARLRRWINYWIGRALLAMLPSAAAHGKWIGYFLWGALLLAALLVLYHLLKQLFSGAPQPLAVGKADDASSWRRSAQEWMAEAWTEMRAGDFRRAVRAAYHAGLEILIARNLLDYNPARTNREYLSLLRASVEPHHHFSRLTDQFERVWYGWQPCGRPEAEAFLTGVGALEAPRS